MFLVLQPPFQTSDGYTQFARAVELVRGQIDPAVVTPRGIGVSLPISVIHFFNDFYAVRVDPGIYHVSLAALNRANALRWSDASTFILSDSPLLWPNGSGSYSVFLYLPQVVGIEIARLLNLSLLAAYYLAATLNGICAVAVSWLALRIAGFGKALMFGVLLLPMSLSLYFSDSQDALIIAFGALMFAIVSANIVSPPQTLGAYRRTIVGLSVLGYLLCVDRPPYLPIFLFLFLIPPPPTITRASAGPPELQSDSPDSGFLGRRALPGRWFPIVVGGLLAAGAAGTFLVALKLGSTGVALPHASVHRQLDYQLSNPLVTIGVFWRTITEAGPNWADTFIGELGWYGIGPLLGRGVYLIAGFGLLALALVGRGIPTAESAGGKRLVSQRGHVPPVAWLFGSGVVLFVVLLLTMESLYLAWTPVAYPVVAGVQGRYFLPVAFFAALALAPIDRSWRLRLERPVLVAFATAAVAMLVESAYLLVSFFW